jgi:hypothetical protein
MPRSLIKFGMKLGHGGKIVGFSYHALYGRLEECIDVYYAGLINDHTTVSYYISKCTLSTSDTLCIRRLKCLAK